MQHPEERAGGGEEEEKKRINYTLSFLLSFPRSIVISWSRSNSRGRELNIRNCGCGYLGESSSEIESKQARNLDSSPPSGHTDLILVKFTNHTDLIINPTLFALSPCARSTTRSIQFSLSLSCFGEERFDNLYRYNAIVIK